MSRVGKLPVVIPGGVEISVKEEAISVKGPKGSLSVPMHSALTATFEDGVVQLTPKDDTRTARQQYGLRRTLLANAVQGVTQGFERTLEVIGVGYKVNVQGNTVVLNVGYSHPVNYALPNGVTAKVENNKIILSGCDKQVIGEVAAQIRRVRSPEPYKGKGIKYLEEVIRRKAGKSGGKK